MALKFSKSSKGSRKCTMPNNNEDSLIILSQVAKVRYKEEMANLITTAEYIDAQILEDEHEAAVHIALKLISEARPLNSKQKRTVQKCLEEEFEIWKEINEKKKGHSGHAIGIDLGTTYCCIAVFRNSTLQKAEIIPNEVGNNKIPSYISFPMDDEDYEEGDEPVIGETAKELAHENPRGTIFDVKRMLGRKFNDAKLEREMDLWPFDFVNDGGQIKLKTFPGSTSTPVEVTTLIVAHLKDLAEKYLGCPVLSAVVAVPAYFNPHQKELTLEACKKADLNVLQLVNEPTAAAIAYSIHKKPESSGPKNCLIFDFGGGTLDVAVLTVKGKRIHVKAVGGDDHLGGEDIDNNMVEYCLQKFKEKHGVDLKEKNTADPMELLKRSKRLRRLKLECEKQKRFLSSTHEVVVSLDAMFKDTPLVVHLTRDQFNEINKPIFNKSIEIMTSVLKKSKISGNEIDEIVLVGGSSRIPCMQDLLSNYFQGKHLCRSIDADEAVAVGAALLAFQTEHVDLPNVLVHEDETEVTDTDPLTGLAMWGSDSHIIELPKGDRGLGFSILDYQDPMNPSETVIVVRSLVPGGVAQQDGRLIPGDRLLAVNEINLENASLDQAAQALKGAPRGIVRIAVAKPLPMPDTTTLSSVQSDESADELIVSSKSQTRKIDQEVHRHTSQASKISNFAAMSTTEKEKPAMIQHKFMNINLVQNPSGLAKFKNWTILEEGVTIETPPRGIEKLPVDNNFFKGMKDSCFATTYFWSAMEQRIDLWAAGLTPSVMRTLLPFKFVISEMVGARFDCGGKYKIEVSLQTTSDAKIVKEVALKGAQEEGKAWTEVTTCLIVDESIGESDLKEIRYLVISNRGKDEKFWEGNYGIKFARVCVTVDLNCKSSSEALDAKRASADITAKPKQAQEPLKNEKAPITGGLGGFLKKIWK